MISFQKVTKHYPGADQPALNNVSLEIGKGTIFGILGRSGAGKSTLLRCINRLESPGSGRVLIDGQDIAALSPAALRQYRQQTGMVFQHFNLLHSRTVSQNIELALKIAGMDKVRRKQRVTELLQLVGLEDFAGSWPARLSGGQKQRVGIARALAANPGYLLCDEATSALDQETTCSVLDLLAEIHRKLNITIVLITHELMVVKRICQEVALLEQGVLQESGSLPQIMARPDGKLRRLLLQDGETDRAFRARYLSEGETRCVA